MNLTKEKQAHEQIRNASDKVKNELEIKKLEVDRIQKLKEIKKLDLERDRERERQKREEERRRQRSPSPFIPLFSNDGFGWN